MALQNELNKIADHLEENDTTIDKMVKQKDDEIGFLNNKLVEFDNIIKNYSENLAGVKKEYDRSICDYKKALNKKNDDIRHMKEHYDRVVKDVIFLIKI
jgi:hypothetical protein